MSARKEEMATKLPIPRLQHQRRDSGRRRTSRACDSCRERKTKCDGNKPVCSQCRSISRTNCLYSEAKFVRRQKELESARRKVERYEELLRSISTDLEGPIANRVTNALKDLPTRNPARQRKTSSASSTSPGSLEGNEAVTEDLNRDEKSRATGYIGKTSEIVWMQRLESEAMSQDTDNFCPRQKPHRLLSGDSVAYVNYHLDHMSLPDLEETNAFVLPPKRLVDRLFQVYLQNVQTSLPFIRPQLVREQYNRCYATTQNPGRKWLTIFNLILAIGSVFSRLSRQDIQPNGDENLFFSRAISLNVPKSILHNHDDLQQVQAEALMSFYLLIVSQVNRSWKMIGIAARSGINFGLNLQKKDAGLDLKSDEARNQLWWSIFRLEHLLSVMTGRVSCLGDSSSSAPPPLAFENLAHPGQVTHEPASSPSTPISTIKWSLHLDREQIESQSTLLKTFSPSPSLYFFYAVDLSLVAHAICNGIYAYNSPRIRWSQIESRIALYGKKMDDWLLSLHPSFCFEDIHSDQSQGSKSAFQVSLALNYHSARIILNRPCLKRRRSGSKSSTERTRSRHNNISAVACLQASLSIMRLLPDRTDLAWCYKLLQWWDFLHVLIQATVILLLDLTISPAATRPEEAPVLTVSTTDVLNGAKKGLLWLYCLGSTSEAARRSFRFCNACLCRIATTQDLDLSGIPLPGTSSSASGSSQDGKETVPHQEMVGDPESPRSSQGERSDDLQFQDLKDVQPMASLQDPFASDVDMSDFISFPADEEVEDMLLAMMGFNA